VRISQVNIHLLEQTRRSHGDFSSGNSRTLDGKREEQVGIADCIVVKEVMRSSAEVIHLKGPTFYRDGDTDFALLVAFAAQGQEALVGDRQYFIRHRVQRRRLVEMPVKSPKNPV